MLLHSLSNFFVSSCDVPGTRRGDKDIGTFQEKQGPCPRDAHIQVMGGRQ